MLHIKKIKPLFTSIVTTGDRYTEDCKEGGIVVSNKGDLKLYQKVLAVGPLVRDIKVGDTVMINAANYAVRKFTPNSVQNDMDNNPVLTYRFNWVTIDDNNGNPKDCLFLTDRDILYVFEGEEKFDTIITNNPTLIL